MISINLSTSYKALGESIKNYQKEKNGDHFLIKEIPSEKIIIAIVADGISKLPCDWLASELTCTKFIDFFIELNSKPIIERIKSSTLFTNQHILEIEGKCNGLASTISLIVWEYDNQEFHFVNIGDSRIYKITKNSIQCLTTDDAIKRKKTIITSIGKRVVGDSYLINFVGNSSIKINIKRESIEQDDLILIATDGFYDARKSSFEQRVIELYDSNNLENDFLSLVNFFEMSAKDDMTAILIKNEKK